MANEWNELKNIDHEWNREIARKRVPLAWAFSKCPNWLHCIDLAKDKFQIESFALAPS